jgi:predicted double-glycine peptidase
MVGTLGFCALLLSGCIFSESHITQSVGSAPGLRPAVGGSAPAVAQRVNPAVAQHVNDALQATASRHIQYASLAPAGEAAADSAVDRAAERGINKSFEAVTTTAASLHAVTVRAQEPVRSLLEMRHHNVIIQSWDLSCGAAALATLLRYEWGDPVTEKQVANGLMARKEYIKNPAIVQVREGFSLLDLKRYVEKQGFKGEGFGQLDLNDLIENAPIMVPVDALGYNHFVIFRGIRGDRVLLADPAWGNRTMTINKFKRMWLDYGKVMGHVGFVVKREKAIAPMSKMQPEPDEFVTFD